MYEQESSITERLFFPRLITAAKNTDDSHTPQRRSGSRASRRQRDKRERQQRKQHEKEAAEAREREHRRKRLIRNAQKSIMLWDPRTGPRKPPHESVDLLFSVSEMFAISRTFQSCSRLNYILETIGGTSRGAIERAYDWLIPIISVIPETIVRLPASASCFLLLRAYGTEGEERAQLQDLAQPLLANVRQSLLGEFGAVSASRAFDLLLSDVASPKSNRRRCARRVLYDAIGKENFVEGDDTSKEDKNVGSWMANILHVPNAESIVVDAIGYMTTAATYERGKNLKSLIFALRRHVGFAQMKNVKIRHRFPDLLVTLIASRPDVTAHAMTSFPELRGLAINTVHDEFVRYSEEQNAMPAENDVDVSITLCKRVQSHTLSSEEPKAVRLPLALLQSACVLLSLPSDDTTAKELSDASPPTSEIAGTLNDLAGMLLHVPSDNPQDDTLDDRNDEAVHGLASAISSDTGKAAVSVESWIILARSSSDFVARRAAMAAPIGFLPRLLLCSGLPRGSFATMIERLNLLGNRSNDVTKTFNQLMAPSTTSEWDIGRVGQRKTVLRRLLGRVSAYLEMYSLAPRQESDDEPGAFLVWLQEACKEAERGKGKPRHKKQQKLPSNALLKITQSSSGLFERLNLLDDDSDDTVPISADSIEADATDFVRSCRSRVDLTKSITDMSIGHLQKLIADAISAQDPSTINSVLNGFVRHRDQSYTAIKVGAMSSDSDALALANVLLGEYHGLIRKPQGLGVCVLTWVPRLTSTIGDKQLWQILFSNVIPSSLPLWNSLLIKCLSQWSTLHIRRCTDWILQQRQQFQDFDAERMVRFVVKTSSAASLSVEGISQVKRGIGWCDSEFAVEGGTALALSSIRQNSPNHLIDRITRRDGQPDELTLLLIMARCGRPHTQCICRILGSELATAEGSIRGTLLAIVLRLYALFPNSLNLGDSAIRATLKEGVERFAEQWVTWRSPMDDTMSTMLRGLSEGSIMSSISQSFQDLTKKHPLLVFRKIHEFVRLLHENASVKADVTLSSNGHTDSIGEANAAGAAGMEQAAGMSNKVPLEEVGMLNTPVPALVDGRAVAVRVSHWGCSFTYAVWMSLLQIISVMPGEVVFGCGPKLGLTRFLEEYLYIVYVQSYFRQGKELARLKAKLQDVLNGFKKSNPEQWQAWLSSRQTELRSLGTVRNVLVGCSLLPYDEAMQSIKGGTTHKPK